MEIDRESSIDIVFETRSFNVSFKDGEKDLFKSEIYTSLSHTTTGETFIPLTWTLPSCLELHFDEGLKTVQHAFKP
ncbi:Hypothetical predicted protein [Octopus vulgaris]|uniref:Uncharacterized protein n=1 Tax=Octopus vulgaris TaxID=6645 RepID=A0AA36BLM8_OCTVU|nr:Hypothetical predicted protein [Octopus vulgaris]